VKTRRRMMRGRDNAPLTKKGGIIKNYSILMKLINEFVM